ncbi:MAG: hypothetical protein ABGZ17_14045 [Planctomycetaceae bacterium]
MAQTQSATQPQRTQTLMLKESGGARGGNVNWVADFIYCDVWWFGFLFRSQQRADSGH